MDYNTNRNHLILPEYGRHIQNLVTYIKTIEDKTKRTEAAVALIPVMLQVNRNLKEVGDYKHKLWDHLYIMADFDLDVDSPFPMPKKEIIFRKPAKVPYNQSRFQKKQYGKLIRQMIDKVDQYTEEEQKDLTRMIANQLKKSHVKWNKSSISDEVILSEFEKLAGHKINFEENIKLVEVKETRPVIIKKHKKQRR